MLALTLCILTLLGLFMTQAADFHGRLFALRYNSYAVLSLAGFAANVIVLWMLVRRGSRTDERTWLALFVAGFTIFALSEGLQRLSLYPDVAIFWTTISGLMNMFAAGCMFLFALAYTGRTGVRHNGTIVGVLITFILIGYFYCATQVVFKNTPDAIHLFPWGYNNDPGDGFAYISAWAFLLYVLSVVRLIQFRRQTANPILRKQSFIYILAIVVPVIVGLITDGVIPAVNPTLLPPMAMLFSTVTGACLTYGVLRYKLLTVSPISFSETILSIIHEAVVVTDTAFTILYMNPEAESLLGVKGNTATQRSLMQFVHVKNHAQALKNAYEQNPTALPGPLAHIDVYKDSTSHKTPVRVTNSRLLIEEVTTYVLVLADITAELESKSIIERTVRLRTKELHEARAYLVASINSLDQGFILVDAHGKLEIANQAASHALTSGGANMEADTLVAMTRPMTWDVNLGNAVQTVLHKRESQQQHVATENGDFYDLYLTPVLSGERAIGATILIEDVTEQRVLERSRDEFFSIASHELRTPLTAIRGNAGMVKDSLAAPPDKQMFKPEEMVGMVDDIHSASVRLIEIVNDFLDTSRLEQGKMTFDLQATDLFSLAQSVQQDFAQALEKEHTTIKYDTLETTPLVYVDRARLRQIMYNVVDNAVRYTQNGAITISGQSDGKHALIRFIDSGAGISTENQKLLFHKLQQASDSILTRDTTHSTGLGLYTSRLIAEGMGGSLVLEYSESGKGSTFLLTLPLAPKAEPQPQPVQAVTKEK